MRYVRAAILFELGRQAHVRSIGWRGIPERYLFWLQAGNELYFAALPAGRAPASPRCSGSPGGVLDPREPDVRRETFYPCELVNVLPRKP